MKKYGKRIISAMLVTAILLCGALTGCGKDSGTDKEEGAEKKKLVLWHVNTAEHHLKLINDAVARYEEDHPGVTVENVPVQSDAYEQKLSAAMGATAPDVFITWGGGKLSSYVEAGKVLDITEYMEADNYKERFIDASMTHVTYKGNLYGVPVENISVALFLYDKDLFEKYNVKVPETYDELMAACETFKKNDVAPFALGNKFKWPGSMYYMYGVLRYGGSEAFSQAADRLGGSFEDSAFIKAGELIQDWTDKGYFCEGYNSLDQDAGQPRNLMFSGKAAMMLMGTWEMDTIKAENPEFFEHMGYFPFPELPGGTGNKNDVVGTVGDNFYSVSTDCKNPDEAFELIQYLIDDASVEERIAAGKVPPVKDISVDDPMQQGILDILSGADTVQLWYDQYLPPELAEVHLDTSQKIFGGEMTSQEAAAQLEKAAKEYYEE